MLFEIRHSLLSCINAHALRMLWIVERDFPSSDALFYVKSEVLGEMLACFLVHGAWQVVNGECI